MSGANAFTAMLLFGFRMMCALVTVGAVKMTMLSLVVDTMAKVLVAFMSVI